MDLKGLFQKNKTSLEEHPLFKAARKGNTAAVERLCKNGADPNQRFITFLVLFFILFFKTLS